MYYKIKCMTRKILNLFIRNAKQNQKCIKCISIIEHYNSDLIVNT